MTKATTCIILVLALSDLSAQDKAVTSGLYNWKTNRDPHELTLTGSTTFFDSFEVYTETYKAGQKKLNEDKRVDTEELIIVKEGELTVTVGDKKKSIGPGSVAFIMPGEKYSCQNSSGAPAVFYRLAFKSKLPADMARGNGNGGSFIIDWKDLTFKPSDVGGRRDFFNKPTATCNKYEMHVTTLNEGLPSHPPHTHPEEEIILLMKGNATMMVSNKDYPLAPGDFVFAASGDFHGIRNTGKGQCEYFAFQWK